MANTQPTGPSLVKQDTGQRFPLTKELITIGRKTGNTIVLPPDDLKASRHHATISYENGRYILQDVGSVNGTFLNNQRISKPQPLSDGDIIGVGESVLQVNLPLGDTEPSIAPPHSKRVTGTFPVDSGETFVRVERRPFVENPYVGPRTFTREESDRFFGREIEARELFSLVISERLVLFYAQSGAGKSSLINTRLIPQLQEAGYPVLPVGRVSGELPQGITDVENIYLFNLLLSMDESDSDPHHFTHMSLPKFLAGLTSLDGVHYFYDHDVTETPEVADEEIQALPYVLLIDQFEEIVTTHPSRWQDREGFFEQLAAAMAADPYLWVVLSLREDYVAALDPYAHLLPGNLRARLYMQRMGYEAALEAVEKPAEKYGRAFAPGVAESLVDNLRQIRVHDASATQMVATRLGQFVEPVQLQVVCYQLWQNLTGRPKGEITHQDLQELGDVDLALAQFYEQAIAEAISRTSVSEIDLRNWFEQQLITESGTKGTVYRGTEHTGGIDNRVVDILMRKFLLRAEVRGGGTWYELVHDRLIEPILKSNQSWREQQPLIQMARSWAEAGKPQDGLLEGQQLEAQLATNWQGLGPLVKEFLETSQTAQKAKHEAQQAEQYQQAVALAKAQQQVITEQERSAKKLRNRAMWITLVGIVAILMAVAAAVFGLLARQSLQVAQERAAAAETAEAEAVAARLTAEVSREQAEDARSDAVVAQGTAVAESTVSAESKATAEAGSTAAAANAAEAKRLLEAQQATQTAEAVSLVVVEQTRVALEATVAAQEATLTAPTATGTPTYTPLPPTATPVGAFTPQATETPTPTPTATETPTPNATATANRTKLDVLSTQVAQVSQAPAQDTCKINVGAELTGVYNTYQRRLGCPIADAVGGEFAEQPFENGFMIWSGIYGEIYAYVGNSKGEWLWFDQKTIDSFGPSDSGSCSVRVPSNRYQPVRGFGAVWCASPGLADAIGFGLKPEYGVSGDLIQKFENGVIIHDSQRRYWVSFADDATYVREE